MRGCGKGPHQDDIEPLLTHRPLPVEQGGDQTDRQGNDKGHKADHRRVIMTGQQLDTDQGCGKTDCGAKGCHDANAHDLIARTHQNENADKGGEDGKYPVAANFLLQDKNRKNRRKYRRGVAVGDRIGQRNKTDRIENPDNGAGIENPPEDIQRIEAVCQAWQSGFQQHR